MTIVKFQRRITTKLYRQELGRLHSFAESDHEIFSTVFLSLLLIQEGQLSISGESVHNTG